MSRASIAVIIVGAVGIDYVNYRIKTFSVLHASLQDQECANERNSLRKKLSEKSRRKGIVPDAPSAFARRTWKIGHSKGSASLRLAEKPQGVAFPIWKRPPKGLPRSAQKNSPCVLEKSGRSLILVSQGVEVENGSPNGRAIIDDFLKPQELCTDHQQRMDPRVNGIVPYHHYEGRLGCVMPYIGAR
ncbi:hypothetical protein HD554DRAFT_2329235 [Boletus coccyginus]|nr:hypothetical protein HD554DRAFT_2329235 [Boletus coccyginus]